MFEIYKSQRNVQKMTYMGFCYTIRRIEDENIIWRCEKRSCYGTAYQIN
jgi:hypothetical protein